MRKLLLIPYKLIGRISLSNTARVRVFIMVGNDVLVLRGQLERLVGLKEYSLPGGGMRRQETALTAALREVHEEIGVQINAKDLIDIGTRKASNNNIQFQAYYFLAQLKSKPKLTKQRLEIAEAMWVDIDRLDSLVLSSDVKLGLEQLRQHLKGCY